MILCFSFFLYVRFLIISLSHQKYQKLYIQGGSQKLLLTTKASIVSNGIFSGPSYSKNCKRAWDELNMTKNDDHLYMIQ